MQTIKNIEYVNIIQRELLNVFRILPHTTTKETLFSRMENRLTRNKQNKKCNWKKYVYMFGNKIIL